MMMGLLKIAFRFLWVIFLLVFLVSCQDVSEGPRRYEEIVIASPTSRMIFSHEGIPSDQMDTAALDSFSNSKLKLSWQLPVDWVEREKTGMRLASFSSGSGVEMVECTIVSLEGKGGGVKENVKRWMTQINLLIPTESELEDFLSRQEDLKTSDGFPIAMIDFTELKSADHDASMIASIITMEEYTLFVKMTGIKSSLIKNRDKFKFLCQSLKIKT